MTRYGENRILLGPQPAPEKSRFSNKFGRLPNYFHMASILHSLTERPVAGTWQVFLRSNWHE